MENPFRITNVFLIPFDLYLIYSVLRGEVQNSSLLVLVSLLAIGIYNVFLMIEDYQKEKFLQEEIEWIK